MIPVFCHSCGQRFSSSAQDLLDKGTCLHCGSIDIDYDDGPIGTIAMDVMSHNPKISYREAEAIAHEVMETFPILATE